MTSYGSPDGNVLYLVVCAVPGADRTIARIEAEKASGWDVCVVATSRSLHWFDASDAERVSGHPLQTRMRVFGEALFEPLGDAVVVAPASFNTINRIAAGFADDMPTGLVCEAMGRGVPVTIEPQLSVAFARHPRFRTNITLLEEAGVTFVWHDPATRAAAGR